jgi:hypothetical protein
MQASNAELKAVFQAFTGGKAEMEGRDFVKLCKDTKIIDKHLTTTDLDIYFAKVKDKTVKKITFTQFEDAIRLCATKKKVTFDDLCAVICKAGGPKFEGTKADAVKFHDDKSLYTGVHNHGGPSTVDVGSGKISDISQLCDRTGADVRGVKK